MAEPQDVSWSFRENVRIKIEEAIRLSGNPTTKTVAEMENDVFQKAKSKEEYLSFVARLIIHIREMAKPTSEAEIGRSHDHLSADHRHTHQHWRSGDYATRDLPLNRTDFDKRAFTVGIGGPVGSGKTALILSLCKVMREKYNLCIVTNDIFTREDWEFLVKNEALPSERIRAVETRGCPRAAIRKGYSLNMEVVKDLTKEFKPNMIFLEAGGDNLAANFSRDLADYIIYVIDVAGGDKIPRKGGPGITESDLLVINKVDLTEAVGASILVMMRDAEKMRGEGPIVITEAKHMKGVETVATHILLAYQRNG